MTKMINKSFEQIGFRASGKTVNFILGQRPGQAVRLSVQISWKNLHKLYHWWHYDRGWSSKGKSHVLQVHCTYRIDMVTARKLIPCVKLCETNFHWTRPLHHVYNTGRPVRMSHRKWRETEQQLSWLPDLALLGSCLLSLHFLCDIQTGRTVYMNTW